MRQIKFRVWDKKNKTISKAVMLDFYNGIVVSEPHYVNKIEDCELMQFTGLTDKNEKEIYEGDICTDGKHTESIKWIHGKWEFFAEDCLLCYNSSVKLKILGNIFENPELLQ